MGFTNMQEKLEKHCFAYAMKMQIQSGDFHGPSARTSPGLNKYLPTYMYIRVSSRFQFKLYIQTKLYTTLTND